MKFFTPKESIDVFSILTYQLEKADEAALLLKKYMKNREPALAEEIRHIEEEADEKRSAMIKYVENTYITALDRRDLYALSRTLDDITDVICDIKDYLVFFTFKVPEGAIEAMDYIHHSLTSIIKAIPLWNEAPVNKFLRLLKEAEYDEGDIKRLYWRFIRNIDENEPISKIIAVKELYKDICGLAAIVCKASDRISDLRIKSLK